MFLAFRFVILTFFSSRGWEPWDIAARLLIPERMPVLVDDDPMFEDGPGAPHPVVAVNQWGIPALTSRRLSWAASSPRCPVLTMTP